MRTQRRTMRFATALAASTLMAAGTATPAQAAEVYLRPADGTIEITGRGYGHGRGMSQYGAMNAARQGASWQTIIAHYYPGTVLSRLGSPTIRVGVTSRLGSAARVAAEPGLVATDGAGVTVALATADGATPIRTWQVDRPSIGGTSTTATLWFTNSLGQRKALRSTSTGRWTIRDSDGTVTAVNAAASPVATYVGSLTGHRTGTGITPVVTTTLDAYTRQVVPFESPGSWPVQALAAQSVAARSYAAAALRRPRSSLYDICDSTTCQVFGGITAETANSRTAVTASSGVIATSGGVPANTQFGSSNGGQRVYGNTSYLPSAADAFEAGLAPTANTWTTSVPVSTLERAHPSIGSLQSVTVLRRDGKGFWGGRVQSVRLAGSSGYVDLTGDQFRSLTRLRSTYFIPLS